MAALRTALTSAEKARDELKNVANESVNLKTENTKLNAMLTDAYRLIENVKSATERQDWALVSDILDPNDTPNLGPELR